MQSKPEDELMVEKLQQWLRILSQIEEYTDKINKAIISQTKKINEQNENAEDKISQAEGIKDKEDKVHDAVVEDTPCCKCCRCPNFTKCCKRSFLIKSMCLVM